MIEMDQNSILSLEIIQSMVNFAAYFILAFIGSLFKEISITNNDEKHDFEPFKVVVSTTIASLLIFAAREYYADRIGQYWTIPMLMSLVLGFVGFEIFSKVSKLKVLMKLIKLLQEADKEVDLEESDDKPKPKEETREEESPCVNTVRLVNPMDIVECQVRKPEIHNPNEIKKGLTDEKI